MRFPEYDKLGPDELRARLRSLRNDLEDLQDTFNFNLANTPAHQPPGLVEAHEEELGDYRARIAYVEARLAGA